MFLKIIERLHCIMEKIIMPPLFPSKSSFLNVSVVSPQKLRKKGP